MIHVIDYGLGNVQAFCNLFKRLGVGCVRTSTPEELLGASKVILPGVGAFDHAITLLDSSGMMPILEDLVQVQKIPILGVCVGMQILAGSSDEGVLQGLGWVDGQVKDFSSNVAVVDLPTPHMGWNDVSPNPDTTCLLFNGLEDDARFYFLHSYYMACEDRQQSIAQAHYGMNFDCAVQKDNVFGVQFHPEKSHRWGAMLLQNFARL